MGKLVHFGVKLRENKRSFSLFGGVRKNWGPEFIWGAKKKMENWSETFILGVLMWKIGFSRFILG